MNLLELAEKHLSATLENSSSGFGWPLVLTNPESESDDFTGQPHDISQKIDPETGLMVSGRNASVSLRLSSLSDKGFSIPRGITSKSSKPWIVQLNDTAGNPHKFKVADAMPDRTLGLVTLMLEHYVD